MEKPKCKLCKSEHIVKYGFKMTKSKGRRQRYLCQFCGSTFYLGESNERA